MSAYGDGAPTYVDADLQRSTLEGRLRVAVSIRDSARATGNTRSAARWDRNVQELLDRLLEVRGR